MKTSRIANVIGLIDDDLVSGAYAQGIVMRTFRSEIKCCQTNLQIMFA